MNIQKPLMTCSGLPQLGRDATQGTALTYPALTCQSHVVKILNSQQDLEDSSPL